MAKKTSGGLAYSTEKCPRCGWPRHRCACSRPQGAPPPEKGAKGGAQGASPGLPKDGIVRVSRQTKGRKGKGVTLIHGVPLSGAELKVLGKELKARCGSGGTVKDGVIEVQGDHRDTVIPLLEGKGYKVKKAGG